MSRPDPLLSRRMTARGRLMRVVYANGAACSVIAALDYLFGEASVVLRDAGTGGRT